MGRISVVVVDDSALVRSLLAEIINRQPDMVCIGSAADPYEAREVIRSLNPDVITLDVEMPRMDGLDFLEKLMRLRPMPVIMVSTLTERGADVTLRALELGAVDFVAKPKIGVIDGLRQLSDDISDKIRVAAQARMPRAAVSPPASAPGTADGTPDNANLPVLTAQPVIFIGASTGGTEATREVLAGLPPNAPPVLVTQHMPAGFTESYARRLDNSVALRVKEAQDQEPVVPGTVYVAPGGRHLEIRRVGSQLLCRVHDADPVNRHRPSVQVLFESAARSVGPNAIGVMLTGMGNDGAAAMRRMREAGAYNVCQDEASCVVFGMPREAIRAEAVHTVVPLKDMAAHLMAHLRRRRPVAEKGLAGLTGS